MSCKLEKPYTEKQKSEFIVKHIYNEGLRMKETSTALYALKPNEIMVNDEPQTDPEYEEKQKEKERERIMQLSLTKREVFLALYKAKQITPEQLKSQITDTEALIEFEYANEYFRGNPLIDLIGAKLGYTSDDLDYLFQNKELPVKEEKEANI